MKRYSLILSAILIIMVSQTAKAEDVIFEKCVFSYANSSFGYRKAVINNDAATPLSIILYLHGGTSKGSDNEKQMSEPGIYDIADYVEDQGMRAIIIVPQCPEKDAQGNIMAWTKMIGAVKRLIDIERKNTSAYLYAFGGSMGGTGLWNILSQYPGLFNAAMPCAGNPKGCSPEAISHTPVYAVMGSNDKIMKPEDVQLQTFLNQVAANGGTFIFDTEEGWSHEMTCTQSYTSERLAWVFSHTEDETVSCDTFIPCEEPATIYYNLNGIPFDKSSLKNGIFIVRTPCKAYRIIKK